MLVIVAVDDGFSLGVLNSRIHVTYALAAGGRLGVGNDPRYNKSRCFDPFPFPDCTEPQRERIRKIAEELDAHRKRVQAQHPGLTLTGMYNVLEKIRTNQPLNSKDKDIHDQALVSLLKQLHDDLDAAVFEAYNWPKTLTDAEILERLVQLNAERAREESQGQIRWLRPDYQIPLFSKTHVAQISQSASLHPAPRAHAPANIARSLLFASQPPTVPAACHSFVVCAVVICHCDPVVPRFSAPYRDLDSPSERLI
jgi:hypothetical protein